LNVGSVTSRRALKRGRRERVRAEHRAEFLRAAARVFGEKGYHAASIAEIAQAAEYGTGTIYLYFRNKEELYAALLEEKTRELADAVRRRVNHQAEPWDALGCAVRAQLEFYEQNRTFFQALVRERLEVQARLRREKWAPVTRAYERFIRFLARLIRRGQRQRAVRAGNSRRLAMALSGIVNQLTRDSLRRRPNESLAAHAGFVVDLFRHGAGKNDK
jgi:AcrR family transcriptional regulator